MYVSQAFFRTLQKTEITEGIMLWTQHKKLRLLEALFSDVSEPKKTQITKKTEAKKLRLPEGRAYRVLQKSVQKRA